MYTWKSARSHLGVEWMNYPSPLAQKRLLYVMAIGKAKTPRHFHHKHGNEAGFLLHLIHRGTMWHRLRGQTYQASAGTVCLMDMSEPVEYGNEGPAAAHNWWFTLNGKDMPSLFTELRADRDPVFRNLESARGESLFNEMLALTRREPAAYEIKLASLILAFMAELFASRAQTGKLVSLVGRTAVLSEPVRRGIDYITRFHSMHLSLKHLAQAVEVSMYHFARVFHKETGVTPIEYLNRHRIEQAKRLLVHSNKPIGQIGKMVGIGDPAHFARLFRRYAGVPPFQFRTQGTRRREADYS